MTTENPRLIVAGGGTGGHVLAGVAVADTWKTQMGGKAEVSFVGASGGIEEKLVPRAGYSLELLHLGSFNRVSAKQKIKTMLLIPLSIWKSIYILLVRRPDAVLGVGGYASGPLVLTAKLLRFFGLTRTKTAILEQNSVPGMTNRMLGRWVDTVFCAFPGTEKQFPTRANSVILTGNPVRSSMERFPSASRDPFTIFIFGGSQGAMGINTLMIEALPHLSNLKSKLRFVHQTGERDYERVKKAHEAAGTGARVEKFIYDMPEVYRQSSLLICRAGSSTLSEIATVGRAAVLVPFPQASDNHQEKNARVFSDAGAAFLMLQGSSKGEDLARLIGELVANPAKIDQMEKSVTAFYRPKAASDIVAELLKK
jgi:UDP-N-acetylglucosamine--N-acetylmuramyl-(pentapeptide) pyrophosphoryl-undecaprenol N-acetylglucosamine transferase